MNVIKVLSVIFVLVGIVLLGFGWSSYSARREFLHHATTAEGTVTEVIGRQSTQRGKTTTTYYYKVKYQTARGEVVEFVTDQGNSSAEYQVGETVPVLYDRTEPTRAAINSFSLLWFNTALLNVLGGCLLGIGSTNLWITARPARTQRSAASLRELKTAISRGRLRRDSEYQSLLVAVTFVGFFGLGFMVMIILFWTSRSAVILALILLLLGLQILFSRRRSGKAKGSKK